jgi:DNA-binding response OmpR family regulator
VPASFNPALTIVAVNCLGALARVWRHFLPGRKPGLRIAIADSQLAVAGSEERFSLVLEERDLLALLLQHRGTVFTPETILSRLWWPEHPYTPEFLADTVAALNVLLHRAGLPEGMIETVQGVGYRLKPHSEVDSARRQ